MSRLKEWVKSALEKWIVGIIAAVFMFIGTAAWDYWQRFYPLPEKMEVLETKIQYLDSLVYELENQNNQYQKK